MARSGNPNPVEARRGKKRKSLPDAGTVKRLQAVLWDAIETVSGELEGKLTPEQLARLTHALSQAGSTYLKAVGVGEYEALLEQLREEVNELKAAGRAPGRGAGAQAAVN